MHWECRGMAVNFVLGKAIIFWKIEFFMMGKVNTHKLVPIPYLTHMFLFLAQLEIDGVFSLTFFCISFIFH